MFAWVPKEFPSILYRRHPTTGSSDPNVKQRSARRAHASVYRLRGIRDRGRRREDFADWRSANGEREIENARGR